MPRPKTKEELLAASQENFDKLLGMIAPLPEAVLLESGACVDWSIKDILAHLYAWHKMYLIWYREGMKGEKTPMPAPGFSWKDTPGLNEQIYQQHKDRQFDEILSDLECSHSEVMSIIESHTDEELFTKKCYAWTGSTSMGSYTVSATASHYDWAIKEIKRFLKSREG